MKYTTSATSKYKTFLRRLPTWTVVIFLVFISVITFSKTAHAGLISLVNSLFGGEQVSAKVSSSGASASNSQTIAILTPANNRDPNPEKGADIVPIDAGAALVPDLAAQNVGYEDQNTEISTYVVRSGDTISGVAKMFNVSVNTILWANNLNGKSVLRAGQTLVILPITGVSYSVKSGDTLQGIANRYKADINDVLVYNDLTLSSKLVIGQKIIIPDAEMSGSDSSTKSATGTKTTPSTNNLVSIPGYFIRPVVNAYKSQGLHGHNGIDFAAPVGTPIRASASGTVIIDKMNGEYNGGYGNYVVISHPNGTQTLYAHMLRSTVDLGEELSQGQTIGYIGMTGRTTGPHVHFEIRGAKNPF